MKTEIEPETENSKLKTDVNPLGIITNAEFCALLGISKKTACRWRTRGILAFVSIQKQVYYKVEDVQKLLDQCSYRNSPKRKRK